MWQVEGTEGLEEENDGHKAGKGWILELFRNLSLFCKIWEDQKVNKKLWKQISVAAITAELCGKPRFSSEGEGGWEKRPKF